MTTAAAADPDKRAPGRPRSARSEQAIVDAVLGMIADGDAIEKITIESIAARAGVGKATIYRRWPNRDELIIDSVASVKLPVPEVAGESLRADLITLVSQIGRPNEQARNGQVMNCLLPQIARNPELHTWYQKVIEPRRDVTRGVLRRGVERGELKQDLDVEVALLMLSAPMILQRTMHWNPAVDMSHLAEQVVDNFLGGALAAG
jgi:AcrR family transcriptional regulator